MPKSKPDAEEVIEELAAAELVKIRKGIPVVFDSSTGLVLPAW